MCAPAVGQQPLDVRVHRVDHRLGEEPAGDAGLVRHHHDAQAGPVERPDRVDALRVQLDALGPIEIADLLDERAVAIEEHRLAPHQPASSRSPALPPRARVSTVMPRMQR